MVVKPPSLVCDLQCRNLTPSPYNLVVILVVADGDRVVNNVADSANEFINFFQEYGLALFNLFLLELISVFEFDLLLAGVFLVGFLFVSDSLANVVPLHLQ